MWVISLSLVPRSESLTGLQESDRALKSAPQHKTECHVCFASTATMYVPILFAASPFAAMRSAPTTTQSTLPLLHNVSGHVVGNYGDWNIVFCQFPRRQSRALQKRPRFVGDYGHAFTGITRATNHPERSAIITGGGQRSGVAVRQHGGAIGNKIGAMTSNSAIGLDVFLERSPGPRPPTGLDFGNIRGPLWFLSLKRLRIRSMAQKRLTAVGRVLRHDLAHVVKINFEIRDRNSDRL